ncbi:type IV pilus assembly protein PilM [Lignipirellula cremea]|uniref:Competence protein A n=1 Tax=Lignipirellula cremea TaxID=2528010 RepID=A0A518DSD9_9BACT|nr:type IV pilus assembly protein PilM [Lignipirellula cremea]QDU94762.1 Competence protein A [Lignipirellula cremea]
MIRWLGKKNASPIGIDLGDRSVKLVQFSGDGSRLVESARWDLPPAPAEQPPGSLGQRWTEAIKRALHGRRFQGREAVVCLSNRRLFLQNIRLPKVEDDVLGRLVQQEAASRIPFPIAEAEIRYLAAAEVRQGDAVMREVILMACHRPLLEEMLHAVEGAKLRPVAVDVEPLAMMRASVRQFRRDEDHMQRVMFVHVGLTKTMVVISQGNDVLFIKYIDVGGGQMDRAVARSLGLTLSDAVSLRRHNGDRRSDQQDPELTRGIVEAVREVIDHLGQELSMCIRYHSVTFRGKPIARLLLGGGEASSQLADTLTERLNLKCELSDPFRSLAEGRAPSRPGQWDIAAGLAAKLLP